MAGAVHVDPGLPMVVTRPHRGVGGDVEHGVDGRREHARQAGRVGQIARDQIDRQALDLRQIRGRAVQRGDLPALCHELFEQIAPEESRAAGDEGAWHVTTCRECSRVAKAAGRARRRGG
jgi:hypothetical protein